MEVEYPDKPLLEWRRRYKKNYRMVWFEGTLMTIQLPWAGTPSIRIGCSEPQFGLRNPGIHKGILMISPH